MEQVKVGRMIAHRVGPTFGAASAAYGRDLEQWSESIGRVADLFARIRTTRGAEVAATVHYAATELGRGAGAPPREDDVLAAGFDWKQSMRPPLRSDEVKLALRSLGMLGWI